MLTFDIFFGEIDSTVSKKDFVKIQFRPVSGNYPLAVAHQHLKIESYTISFNFSSFAGSVGGSV